jgi:hypothetical protein
MSNVLTGALALIKVNGNIVGKARGITVAQNIQRQYVRGIGTLVPSEGPATQWAGTVTFDQYFVDFNKSGLPGALQRNVSSIREFEDQLLLSGQGINVDIFKKVEDAVDPDTGIITSTNIPIAVITRLLLESDNLNIQEGQLSGTNQTFGYLDPIIVVNTDTTP